MSSPAVLGVLITFVIISVIALILAIVALTKDDDQGAVSPASVSPVSPSADFLCLTLNQDQSGVTDIQDINFGFVTASNGDSLAFVGGNSISMAPGTYLIYVSLGVNIEPVANFDMIFRVVDSATNVPLFTGPEIIFGDPTRTPTHISDLGVMSRMVTVTTATTIKVRLVAVSAGLTPGSVVLESASVFQVMQLK